MRFIVEGRHFNDRLQACTFAQRLAEEYNRGVDVRCEQLDMWGRRTRSWICQMHPPNIRRTILREEEVPCLQNHG